MPRQFRLVSIHILISNGMDAGGGLLPAFNPDLVIPLSPRWSHRPGLTFCVQDKGYANGPWISVSQASVTNI